MLKRLLLFFSITSMLAAGYFGYQTWQKRENPGLWGFIPSHAFFVYESDQSNSTLEFLKSQSIWKTFDLIPQLAHLNKSTIALDSVLNQKDGIGSFLDNTKILFSAHKTAKNKIDFLIAAEINNLKDQNILSRIQQQLEDGGYSKKKRTYLNYTITELTSPSGQTFAYLLHKNIFIGSFTPFLTEDAIRTATQQGNPAFDQIYADLFQLAELKQDQGNLYLNFNQLDDFTSIFTNDAQFRDFAKAGFFDIKVNDRSAEFSGFTFTDSGQYLHHTGSLTGSNFDLTEVISNQTGVFFHFGFEDPRGWGKNMLKNTQTTKLQEARKQLMSRLDFDVTVLYAYLGNEAGAAVQYYPREKSNFLFLDIKSFSEFDELLMNVARLHAFQNKDTIYLEYYKEQPILRLPDPMIPNLLVGEIAGDFEECYYATYRNYAILASGLPELKDLLDDIANENTWKKSLRKNRFLDKTNQEASFSIYLNPSVAWPALAGSLAPAWKEIAETYDYLFKNIENIAIQFNSVDNKYFSNILIEQGSQNLMAGKRQIKAKSIVVSDRIISRPFIVKTHLYPEFDYIVQDASNTLYFISKNFSVEWSVTLSEPIIHDIYLIDYYRNGKIQYIFMSPKQVHILDRNGNYLPGFPKPIPGNEAAQWLSLIDYDGSRNYRIAIADIKGNLYLTDKDIKPLKEWNPMKFEAPATGPMRHVRIGGSDVFVVALEQGDLHLLNRQGNPYPGFPVKFENDLAKGLNITTGSNLATSSLDLISSRGEVISINFKGIVQSRSQLLKPDPETHFSMIRDAAQRRFVIGRKTPQNIAVIQPNDTEIFAKDYLNTDRVFMQYHYMGNTRQYISIGEKEGEFIYLYDLNGKLMTGRPIRGNQPIGMLYYESTDSQLIYVVDNNEFAEIRLDNSGE